MAGAVATAPAAAADIGEVMTEGYMGLLALALQHYILEQKLKNTHDGGLLVSDRPPHLLAIKAITWVNPPPSNGYNEGLLWVY